MSLEVKNLAYSYGAVPVLERVSFTAESGMCTALLGMNGAGKSTLLKCIDGILSPRSGTVTADGEDLISMNRRTRARICSYVPQQPSFSVLSVFDSVLLGRSAHITRRAGEHDYRIAERVIIELGLESIAFKNINSLSGGERQKVAVARALACEPKILLLDEPTSNLDIKSREDTVKTIRALTERKDITVVVAMHDINLALRFAESFVLMKDSGVYLSGGREVVTSESIKEVYGIDAEAYELHGQTVVLPLERTKEGVI